METIAVKNYRSIKDSNKIDLMPLTVIVGRNSAGKSSFVRLFPLLKQTLERKISDSLLWYGDYVDFGDYLNTLSKDSDGDTMQFEFSIKVIDTMWAPYYHRRNGQDFIADVTLSIKEKYFDRITIKLYDQVIELNINEDGETQIIVNGDSTPFDKVKVYSYRETGNILPILYESPEPLEERSYFGRLSVEEITNKCIKYIYDGVEQKNMIYGTRFYRELGVNIGSRDSILKSIKRINPQKFERMKDTHKRFERINNLIISSKLQEIIERINQSVNIDMRNTNYVKPIRAMVDRFYRVQGISIDELDADGSNLPMILRNMDANGKLHEFEMWSKEKFGVVFSVTQGEGHISLIIKDDVEGNEVTNVADTGYGYSQMLPIVLMLWMLHSKTINDGLRYSKTIVIEQPELHLHPAYQAKMIDVFVNVIKEAEKNGITLKIIFETHSEAMINRIGTIISQGDFEASKVNVLVFDKVNSHTEIQTKKFNENGLLLGWPIGFFATDEV